MTMLQPPPVPRATTLSYATPATAEPADGRFGHARYVVRRQVFRLLGAAFHVYDSAGNVVMYSKQKAFKLKEDIRVYTGEDMTTELVTILARQIIDFSAAYDVIDSPTGQKVGALKRRGWASMIRDEWVIMDAYDNEVGAIREESAALAIVRRLFRDASAFLPQRFEAELGGTPVASFQQNFNPFVRKLTVDFSMDLDRHFDRRLGLAAAVLLSVIEGRQG